MLPRLIKAKSYKKLDVSALISSRRSYQWSRLLGPRSSSACIDPVSQQGMQRANKKRKLDLNSTKSGQARLSMASNGHVVGQHDLRSIELNDVEEALRRFLLDVARYIDENKRSNGSQDETSPDGEHTVSSRTILRFTGGWVRDKLLGIGSHDIDVAINNMTGYQFGLVMQEYLAVAGNAEKHQMHSEEGDFVDLHKIAANPEKSKHLETVTTRIYDLDIDFVNLRKETYSEDSRNPQMEFGTPEEDAFRRDATVNALFFNLNTSSLEDFTGKGIDDMRKRIIRTPLEPFQTFEDDPLRVLRLIRFASQLGYAIDPQSEHSMEDTKIKTALKVKISRERVGVEIEKMLRGPDPARALSLIHRLELFETVFCDPAEQESPDLHLERWGRAYLLLDQLTNPDITDESLFRIQQLALSTKAEREQAWNLVAFLPWSQVSPPEASWSKNKVSPPKMAQVAREAVKATNKFFALSSDAVNRRQQISELKNDVVRRRTDEHLSYPRDVLGMAIRNWGQHWKSLVLFSLLYETFQIDIEESVPGILRSYREFFDEIEQLDLLDVVQLKNLVDGKRLSQALGRKPGPWVKDALEVAMNWQLRNPGPVDPNGAISEVEGYLACRD